MLHQSALDMCIVADTCVSQAHTYNWFPRLSTRFVVSDEAKKKEKPRYRGKKGTRAEVRGDEMPGSDVDDGDGNEDDNEEGNEDDNETNNEKELGISEKRRRL
jgi:hypothetical protein